jgi:type III secretion protein S
MTDAALISHLNTVLVMILYLSAPVLGVAALVGLTVGLLQAVTQIQDQSLPQTLKLVAILLTIVTLGGALSHPLLRETRRIFDEFPAVASSVAEK